MIALQANEAEMVSLFVFYGLDVQIFWRAG